MAAPYTWLDDARTTAASPRSSGGATLVLADGTKFGAPSPSAPIQVAIRRSDALVVVLLATARSGSSLTISGPAPGYSDAAVQAGDDVLVGPTAADMAAIWSAIDGKQGSLTLTTTGSSGAATLVGDVLNVPQYSGGSGTVTSVSVATANGFTGSVATATTTPAITLSTSVTGLLKGDGTGVSAATPGTDYLTGNQTITLGGDLSGSGTTSITATIASNAVTTAKVNNNAITYAKFQTAASAGIVGASAAGNYGHVTIGAGLSLSGGVLSSTASGTVTSVGLTVPTGLSVSGSPVTGSGTLAVTLGVSGLLKGSAGAIVAAGSGDVTTTLINDKAVTYAKIADAAGAGLLGATGTGAHQLLTIGSGLSLAGTTLSASGGGGSPGGSSGQVQYNASGSFAGSSGLVFDATNKRLGVGASSPASTIDVQANASEDLATFRNSSGTALVKILANGGFSVRTMRIKLAQYADLVAGTNLDPAPHVANFVGTIVKVQVTPNTNPVGGGFTFDVKKAGTSIFSSAQAVAANTTAVQTFTTFSNASVSVDDKFNVDISSPGTGVQFVVVDITILMRNQ